MEDKDTQLNTFDASDTVSPSLLYSLVMAVFSAFCLMAVGIFFISNRRCCKKNKKDDPESVLLKQRLAVEQKKMAKYKFAMPSADHPQFNPIFQQENNEIAKEVKDSYKLFGNASTTFCTDKNKTIMIQNLNFSSNDPNNIPNNKVPYPNNIPKAKVPNNENCSKENLTEDVLIHDNFINNDNTKNITTGSNQHCQQKKLNRPKENDVNDLKNTSSRLKELFLNRWIERSERNDASKQSPVHSSNNLSYGEVDSILTSVSRMDPQRVQRLKESQFYRKILVPTDEYCEGDLSEDSIETTAIDEIIAEKLNKDHDHFNLTHDEIMQYITSKSKQEPHKDDTKCDKNQGCFIINNSIEKKSVDTENDRETIKTKIPVKKTIKESSLITKKKMDDKRQSRHSNDILYLQNIQRSRTGLESKAKLRALRYSEKHCESLFRVIKPTANGVLNESNLTQSENETALEKTDSNLSKSSNDLSELSKNKNSEITLETTYYSRPSTLKLKSRNTDLEITLDSMNNNETKSLKTYKSSNDNSCSSSSSSTTSWKELSEKQKAKKSCNCSEITDNTQITHESLTKASWLKSCNKETSRLELNESTLSELKINTTLSSVNSYSTSTNKFSRPKIIKTKRPKPPRSSKLSR
ncbi:repetitive organellar protein [Hydra vulgaris]|uniref:Repetitive organellar protein n=1 Tax=Hydra vulgaris TaxID=6087 RepID=A0ABM4DEB3_HYDVU